jgi:uncharacterized membrane protein
MPDFDGFFGFMMVVSIVIPLLITGAIIGLFIWIVRRAVPREDPAVAELRARYARGEIEPAEYEVRLRSLTENR